METVAILGSGFGLYGYLPAIAGTSDVQFVMPLRYQAKYHCRPELAQWQNRIQWCSDETSALERCQTAVLALCPEMQVRWLRACLELRNVENLLLEKPIARSPEEGDQLQQALQCSAKNYRIGYLFRFLPWVSSLKDALSSWVTTSEAKPGSIRIDWQFCAHHFRHDVTTWKRDHAAGGGAVRFYGIHLIALLAELGYSQVIHSQARTNAAGEVDAWQAILGGQRVPPCHLIVDSAFPQHRFTIDDNTGGTLFAEDHPFVLPGSGSGCSAIEGSVPTTSNASTGAPGSIDSRVSVLIKLWESLRESSCPPRELYQDVIQFWQNVERATTQLRASQVA